MNRVKVGINDLATIKPEVASEWNYEKNNLLKPSEVSAYSNKKVWWKCHVCGNEWEAQINNRSYGRGCPKCAQEKRNIALSVPKKGITFKEWCIKNNKEELLDEWDIEKNAGLTTDGVAPMSDKVVWWKCKRNHIWQTAIKHRTRGSGCPICKATYKTSFPEQAILYYLGFSFSTNSRKLIDGYEIDVFLPDYNIGVEYDGKYYHTNKKENDDRKTNALTEKGIDLIRVIESDHNETKENRIQFKFDTHYLQLDNAIKELIEIICSKTGISAMIDVNTKRDNIKIVNKYWEIQKDNSLYSEYPNIANEWDYEKNGGLEPQQFSSGSGESVWWRCPKGHSYKAQIVSRVKNNTGCPYCANQKIIEGDNDFMSLFPEIAKEWDYEKNEGINPRTIAPRTGIKIWWKCEKGHSWQTTVASRTSSKTGCPVCANKVVQTGYNDLLTKYPDLEKQWDYEKNGSLMPQNIAVSSRESVWWKCELGHEWKATIVSRAKGNHQCPICAGRKVLEGFNDLETKNPQLAKEWNYQRNGYLTPKDVSCGSGKKVWWKCSVCGNEWQSTIDGRKKHGCPKCARGKQKEKYKQNKKVNKGIHNLSTTRPELLTEWDYCKNELNGIHPDMFSTSSNEVVWWKCSKCGHEWQAKIKYRAYGNGCPQCAINQKRTPKKGNSLAERKPELSEEWDYSKNEKTPFEVNYGSSEYAFWKCKKCGYEWKAKISNRTSGKGCPACSKQVVWPGHNDLETLFPEIAKEFDSDRNGYAPNQIMPKSNKPVWWICSKGHHYEASPSSRTNSNSGCPYCSGRRAISGINDLQTLYPEIAVEWDYEKNDTTPDKVLPGSGINYYWKCQTCGNSWKATVYSRKIGAKCPICKAKTSKKKK